MCGGPGNSLRTIAGLARLIAPVIISQTDAPRVAAPLQITCARCDARVDAGYDWCPRCGASLRATTCAYCGRRIAAGRDDCSSCGAPVLERAIG